VGVELAYQNVGDAPGKTRIKTFKETNLGVVRVYVSPLKDTPENTIFTMTV